MPVASVELKKVALPEFGEPTVMPVVPYATYEARIEALLERGQDFDAFVVYGDREHSANIAYFTGYDPRFEEALLIIVPGRKPKLLVGNEGWGYAELCAGPYDPILYQTFSLPGQPRDRSPALKDILAECGLKSGQKIGAIGWKPFGPEDHGFGETALDLPSFIADTLRSIAGGSDRVVNAAGLTMDPDGGLRTVNEADQLAAFEFAATFTSQGLRNVLAKIEPGMTELQAARLIGMNGLPQSVHPMLTAGRRAAYGLPSPSLDVIKRGDPVTCAYGVHGALNARAGFLVEDAKELPADIRDYVEKLVAPYFSAVVDWYETVGIGVTGGALVESRPRPHRRSVLRRVAQSRPPHPSGRMAEFAGLFGLRDKASLRHGAAGRRDPGDRHALFHHQHRGRHRARRREVARGDRREISGGLERIEARRAFMTDVLGIRLKPEVLPFSNIPAFLPPFWLSRNSAMAVARR